MPRSRPSLFTILLAGVVLGGTGCSSSSRSEGDPSGAYIPFAVTLDEAFVARLSAQHVRVGTGIGLGSGGVTGLGLGIGFQGTTVYLLGGAHPGEASLFRRQLKWGRNDFAIPLAAGRHVVLTIQAEGGRQGWETVGDFTVATPDADQVELKLSAQGPLLVLH